MAVVYVTNFESCAVTGKTAGTKRRKTTLMSKLGKGVGLVHELGQRRRTEEFLDCGHNRTDVNQGLRRHGVEILSLKGHLFADYTLHTGKADTELVLEKFAYRANTTIA